LVRKKFKFTYKNFNERTNRLANGLMALGLSKGDHIAHWLYNCIEMCDIAFAVAKNGLVFATVNPA
jgi:fatty-acyl-CoA synthase